MERLASLVCPVCLALTELQDPGEKREILVTLVFQEQLDQRETEDSLDYLALLETLVWPDFLDLWDQWEFQDPLDPQDPATGSDLTIWRALVGSDFLESVDQRVDRAHLASLDFLVNQDCPGSRVRRAVRDPRDEMVSLDWTDSLDLRGLKETEGTWEKEVNQAEMGPGYQDPQAPPAPQDRSSTGLQTVLTHSPAASALREDLVCPVRLDSPGQWDLKATVESLVFLDPV